MDLGTQRVKAVVLKDGTVVGRGQAFSGFDPTKAAEDAVNQALKAANLKLSDVQHFCSHRLSHGNGALQKQHRIT